MERQQLITMVEAVQQGKEGAAGELYDAFYEDIYYHIFKTVKDSELAADLTQDTFIEILEKIDLLREPAAFVTWSKQIAYHKCTAYFRKRRDLLVNEDEDGNSVFDTISEDREEFIPDEALDKDDLKKTIHAMIDSLPEEQRSALLLRYFNEVPVKDIAKIQSVTEGTVKSRLNYARKAIKQAVESYEKKNGVKLHSVGAVPVLLWLFREYRIENGISLTEDLSTEALISYGEAVANGAAAEMPVDSISSPAAEMNIKTEAAKTSVSSNNLNGTVLTAKAGGKGILRHITRTAAFKAAAATAACVISVGSIAGIMHLTSNENAEEINSEAVVSNESVENELIEEVGSQEVLEETVAVTNMLLKGEEFNELIFQLITDDTLSLSFTNTAVPEGVETIDVSALKDGSAVAYQNGTEVVVTTGDGDVLYANEDCSMMFSSLPTNLKFGNFDTSKVINMSGMFSYFAGNEFLDLSCFDTSNVKSMSGMFDYASLLKGIDLSGFDTGNVLDMYGMFMGCYMLQTLDLSSFDTRNVTSMELMFCNCYELQSLNLSSFDMTGVKNVRGIFMFCDALTEIYAANWTEICDLEDEYAGSELFLGCYNLMGIDKHDEAQFEESKTGIEWANSATGYFIADPPVVNEKKREGHFLVQGEDFNTVVPSHISIINFTNTEIPANVEVIDLSAAQDGSVCAYFDELDREMIVTTIDGSVIYADEDCSRMFNGLKELSLINFDNYDTSYVKDMSYMFQGCYSLTKLDTSGFNTSNVQAMNSMFRMCDRLETVNLSGIKTANVKNMSGMFYGCRSLSKVNVSKFDTSKVEDMSEMFHGCRKLEILDLTCFDTSSVTNMSSMFYDCASFQTLDLSNFDTSRVTDMSAMFGSCTSLQTLDLSNFDTSRVTDMSAMFDSCASLQTLDLSGFITENVTDMAYMFMRCELLQELNVSSFDTSKVTDMSCMFTECQMLEEVDLSSFDTSSVTNMYEMFQFCFSLRVLDISSFDTSKVTDMEGMFYACKKLTVLDMTGVDVSKVTSMNQIFHGCFSLQVIYASDWQSANSMLNSENTDLMFSECHTLSGAVSYNEDYVDIGMASPTKGYFTQK